MGAVKKSALLRHRPPTLRQLLAQHMTLIEGLLVQWIADGRIAGTPPTCEASDSKAAAEPLGFPALEKAVAKAATIAARKDGVLKKALGDRRAAKAAIAEAEAKAKGKGAPAALQETLATCENTVGAAREVADAARAVLAEAEGALQEARAEVEAKAKMEEAAANEVRTTHIRLCTHRLRAFPLGGCAGNHARGTSCTRTLADAGAARSDRRRN